MTITMTAIWDALGWAILHSLWQGALIGAVVWLVRAILTERRATARYAVGMAGLIATCVAFFSTFVWLVIQGATPVTDIASDAAPLAQTMAAASEVIIALQALPRDGFDGLSASAFVPLLGMIWVLGFLFLSVQAIRAWSHTRWLATNGLRTPSRDWSGRFDVLLQKIGASARVKLFVSEHVAGPMTLGALRPIVLVPVGFLTGLPSAQVEAILLHELAHIRRHDFLFGLLQTAIKTVLYFNPAVWLMSKAIDADREQACDDLAIKVGGKPVDLVRGLAALRLKTSAPELVMAADGGPLLTRLNRLMGRPASSSLLRGASNRLSAAALSAMMLGTAACTSVSMANPQPASDRLEPPAAPEAPTELPETVIRSKDGKTVATLRAPTPPQAPTVITKVDGRYMAANVPPMPVMPPAPTVPPVPPMPPIAFGPDGDSDDFEAAMEAWGEKMEAWGEEVEARFEGEWEADMEAWGEEVEAWADEFEIEMEGLEDLAELEALKALESLESLEDLEALSEIGRMAELSAREAERRSDMAERERERIERQVEREMERAERHQEQMEREVERQVRQAERQMRDLERQVERAQRDAERVAELEAKRIKSQFAMNHTVEISTDSDKTKVIIGGKMVNVVTLRDTLYDALIADGLVRSDRSAVALDVSDHSIRLNGRDLSVEQSKRYLEIISEAGLCPDEPLKINLTSDATRIVRSHDGKDWVAQRNAERNDVK